MKFQVLSHSTAIVMKKNDLSILENHVSFCGSGNVCNSIFSTWIFLFLKSEIH